MAFTPCYATLRKENRKIEFDPIKHMTSDNGVYFDKKGVYNKAFGEPMMLKKEELDEFDTSDFEKSGGMLNLTFQSYPCCTQYKATKPNAVNPEGLWLGHMGKVVLWHKGDTINFAAHIDGYPSKNHALYAASKLWEAAKLWNAANIGVQFKWVDKWEDAEFALAYGGSNGDTLAMAFFPNTDDLNTLFVYSRAFDNDAINYQANIFAHELGHVLGLRHEFAKQEGDAVIFGPENPNSVMSYKFPPVIQNTDVIFTRNVYDYAGSSIGGYPVVRVHPDN